MKIVTATSTSSEIGPLTKRVYGFVEAQMQVIAAGVTQPSDWDPLTEFIDLDRFKRVGAYLEELDWEAYKNFLTGWIAGGTKSLQLTVPKSSARRRLPSPGRAARAMSEK